MGSNFKALCLELEGKIERSYQDGIIADDAERLAGQFLGALMTVSSELRKADLDSRMRKSGLKAVRAAVYMDNSVPRLPDGKKPTEAALAAIVDMHEIVQSEQGSLDTAEVDRDELERYFSIFQAAHVHYRTIAKGVFGG